MWESICQGWLYHPRATLSTQAQPHVTIFIFGPTPEIVPLLEVTLLRLSHSSKSHSWDCPTTRIACLKLFGKVCVMIFRHCSWHFFLRELLRDPCIYMFSLESAMHGKWRCFQFRSCNCVFNFNTLWQLAKTQPFEHFPIFKCGWKLLDCII